MAGKKMKPDGMRCSLGGYCAIVWLAVASLLSLPAQGALPDPKTHLKDFPVLKDYFTFGAFNVTGNPNHYPWMAQNLGLTAQEFHDLQTRVLAVNGINTVLLDTRLPYPLAAARKYELSFIAERLYWYNMPFDQCKKGWIEYVKLTKDEPDALAWYVYDEPDGSEDMILKYIDLKNAIYEVDKAHPTVEITSGVDERQARQTEYYMWDDYPFWSAAFSGGNIRELRGNARRAAVAAPLINVAVLQGCVASRVFPVSPVDVRAQTYLVLANGSNGVMYYHAGFRYPAWRKWTPADKACDISTTREATLLPVFGCATEQLKELSRIGELITPAGYLLVGARFVPNTDAECKVECRQTPTFATEADAQGVYRHRPRNIAAVEVGVWRRSDSRVFIPYNNSLDAPESASIKILSVPNGAKLYDLWTLKECALDNSSFHTDLDAGDGRFYLLAAPEVFQREKRKILGRKLDLERKRLKIQTDLAAPCGLLALTPVNDAVAEAAASAEKGDVEKAVSQIQRAAEEFRAAQKASADYSLISGRIESCRQMLLDMDDWLGYRAPILYRAEAAGEPATAGYEPPLGTGLPGLESILVDLRQESGKFLPLAKAFETGKMEGVKEGAQHLSEKLTAIRARLEAYRAETGPETRLGFLTLPGADGPLYDKDAWMFVRLACPRVEMICLAGDGSFADADGKPARLSDYDALWLHYSAPAGSGFLDKERRIPAPEELIAAETVEAFKSYLDSGGGMLLTGLATAYVDDLGLEGVEPNVVELGERGFLDEVLDGASAIYSQFHGLSAVREQAAHPVFMGLKTDGMFFRCPSPAYRRYRASWEYPAVPKSGNVLACFEGRCSATPRNRCLDLVEFPALKGRVLACGAPSMVFNMYFNTSDGRLERFRDLATFFVNMVSYLGDKGRPEFVRRELTGPFCHRDIAKVEPNPGLKWKVSSGSNGGGMYSMDRQAMWLTTDDNAWTECRFAKPTVIDKVCVLSFWRGSQWAVSHLRLKVCDEKTGQFVDLNPPAVFDNPATGLYWDAARFSFNPVRTSAIRLEEIRKLQPKSTPKDRNPVAPPIGIHNVVVFGEGQPVPAEKAAAPVRAKTP